MAIEKREFPTHFFEALKKAAKSGIYAIPKLPKKSVRDDEPSDEDDVDIFDPDGR
jgi:hypothetical protein